MCYTPTYYFRLLTPQQLATLQAADIAPGWAWHSEVETYEVYMQRTRQLVRINNYMNWEGKLWAVCQQVHSDVSYFVDLGFEILDLKELQQTRRDAFVNQWADTPITAVDVAANQIAALVASQ